MSEGSCLCETVRWRAHGKLDPVTHCHCAMCRKAHGAPFASYTGVSEECFEWLSGESAIAQYESSPGSERTFCSVCGSVTPYSFGDARMGIPAGSVDAGASDLEVSAHIFVASMAPWHRIGDDLPRYDTWTPDDGGAVIENPETPAASPGTVYGSCLCATVAFEVRPEWKAVHNCHCSRCRRARARRPHHERVHGNGESRLPPWRRQHRVLQAALGPLFPSQLLPHLRLGHAAPGSRARIRSGSLRGARR